MSNQIPRRLAKKWQLRNELHPLTLTQKTRLTGKAAPHMGQPFLLYANIRIMRMNNAARISYAGKSLLIRCFTSTDLNFG